MPFTLGQRWISDTETDLGLGTVVALEGRMVSLLFPATGDTRHYARQDAPVTRVSFNVGDEVESAEGWSLTITEIVEQDGLITYYGNRLDNGDTGISLKETLLNHFIKLNKPQDRLFAGQLDRLDRYVLRYQCLQQQYRLLSSELRGLVGGRTSLIPHQLHIAREVGHRYAPRVLLADEVGLGKTIEAGMIIHQQLLTGRASRVLLVLPETLQHQWLVEMLRRFNLHFALFDEERCVEAFAEADNPFETEQLVLCSLDFLRKKSQRLEQAMEAGWDLLVVDEAHHLKWSAEKPSREYQVVEALAEETPGLLLLTATPEQLGLESHFARLRLLDPERFYDFEAFVSEQQQFEPVARAIQSLLDHDRLDDKACNVLTELLAEQDIEPMLALLNSPDTDSTIRQATRDELLSTLLDRHGTGRVLFRNTRSAVKGFPGRQLHSYRLELPKAYQTALRVSDMLIGNLGEAQRLRQLLSPETIYHAFEGGSEATWWQHDPRVDWLQDKLQQLRNSGEDEKVLVICSAAETALTLEQALRERAGILAAVFHEGMSIVERDRAAAWFAQQEEGAQVLLCSEIGSEGRNFQFAHHLIMFDLPLDPDLLEQRIGRLDRIGQRRRVEIHVPWLSGTCQGLLLAWLDEGLEAFNAPCPAAAPLYEALGGELHQMMLAGVEVTGEAFAALLAKTRQLGQALESQLEQGRDRLLEIHSAGLGKGETLAGQIAEQDNDTRLPTFMFSLFDVAGIHQEDKGENALVLLPTEHMLVPNFPGLPADGVTITFDRHTALARDDIQFITWDHPMVQGGIDLILGSEVGTASVALLKNRALPAGTLLLEQIFLLQATAPAELQIGRFLPPTPIRLLLDKNGNDLSAKVPFEGLSAQLTPVNRHIGAKLASASQQAIHPLLAKGQALTEGQVDSAVESARLQVHQLLDSELDRLESLKAVNPNIRDVELAYYRNQRDQLDNYLDQASVHLEALRLIVVSHQ